MPLSTNEWEYLTVTVHRQGYSSRMLVFEVDTVATDLDYDEFKNKPLDSQAKGSLGSKGWELYFMETTQFREVLDGHAAAEIQYEFKRKVEQESGEVR